MIHKGYIVFFFLFLIYQGRLFSQDEVNKSDSNEMLDEEPQDTIPKAKHPSKKAMLYSAIVPGGGQVFNHIHLPRSSRRKWNVYWKVPFIYGAIGGSAFMLISQQREIGLLREEFNFRMDNPQIPFQNANYQSFDSQAILQLHNNAQTQRDLFILTTVLAYAINILDASVEAHFINFDVSEDLSLRVQPISTGNFGLGMSFALRFK